MRAFPLGDIDVFENLLELGRRRDRADLRRVEQRIAHSRGLGEGHEPVDEFVVNGAMDERARTGDAGLAGRGEDARYDAFHGIVEDGVLQDDVGRLAAEFERHGLDRARGQFINALPGPVAAGEGDFRDLRMRNKPLADLRSEACHDVDDARREPGLLEEPPNSSAETDENSDGFQTTVLPAASAGASFHVASRSGEFHGVIAATTPSGSSRVKFITPGLSMGMTRPSILSARPPK